MQGERCSLCYQCSKFCAGGKAPLPPSRQHLDQRMEIGTDAETIHSSQPHQVSVVHGYKHSPFQSPVFSRMVPKFSLLGKAVHATILDSLLARLSLSLFVVDAQEHHEVGNCIPHRVTSRLGRDLLHLQTLTTMKRRCVAGSASPA
jgi:hypothetical protein